MLFKSINTKSDLPYRTVVVLIARLSLIPEDGSTEEVVVSVGATAVRFEYRKAKPETKARIAIATVA